MTRCVRSLVLIALLTTLFAVSTSTSSALPEQMHWDFGLVVEPPTESAGSFHATFTTTLVGTHDGIQLHPPAVLTYRWVAVGPNGQPAPLLDRPASWSDVTFPITGTVVHIDLYFTPDQNGEWDVQVWQREDGQQKQVAEQRVSTDSVPGSSSTADPAVTGMVDSVNVDPAQPVVGQPATITFQMAGVSRDRFAEIPLLFVDQDATHNLGPLPDPGPGRVVTLTWTPSYAAEGTLVVFDYSMPLEIVTAAPAGASDSSPTADPDAGAGDGGSVGGP
jgi:hypothetical protein